MYRHFPTRLALFEAVYRDSVERLCADGDRLATSEAAGPALIDWLQGFVTVISQKRGLAAALTEEGRTSELFAQCHSMINATGGMLLDRAKAEGAVRDEVDLDDLLKMTKAFAVAAETSPDGPALAERLLVLSMDGMRPRTLEAPRARPPHAARPRALVGRQRRVGGGPPISLGRSSSSPTLSPRRCKPVPTRLDPSPAEGFAGRRRTAPAAARSRRRRSKASGPSRAQHPERCVACGVG